ncbi:hypothetical protein CDL15_Pgr021388 [Punica granatum]|uniref:Uncharacterized protein n=1 Tax=Punica granatum TaxID=22663 RepID=A0A218WQA1_PUNGR|nr:hypothetical protein CDL15_Pgr021388 [Punica granatum]PKI49633.1 hypothetical protein CRG98_029970 [Punica granatum]
MVSLQRNVADGEEGMTEAEISQLYLAADQVTCLDFGRGTKPHPRSKNCCSDAYSTAQLQAKLEEQQEKFDAQQKQIDWLQKIVEKLMGDQADFGDYSTSSAHICKETLEELRGTDFFIFLEDTGVDREVLLCEMTLT